MRKLLQYYGWGLFHFLENASESTPMERKAPEALGDPEGPEMALRAMMAEWYFSRREPCCPVMLFSMEFNFEVREAQEGGIDARILDHSIFTQAETWEKLRGNVLDAAAPYFEDGDAKLNILSA